MLFRQPYYSNYILVFDAVIKKNQNYLRNIFSLISIDNEIVEFFQIILVDAPLMFTFCVIHLEKIFFLYNIKENSYQNYHFMRKY